MTKSGAIKKELKKLKALFAGMPEKKKQLAEKLIENAAYMAVTLDELQKIVNEEGAVITSTNGNGFEVSQEHPAQKSYNATINRYTAVIKQLNDMMPEGVAIGNKLDKFMSD